jgi:hypothetical protein
VVHLHRPPPFRFAQKRHRLRRMLNSWHAFGYAAALLALGLGCGGGQPPAAASPPSQGSAPAASAAVPATSSPPSAEATPAASASSVPDRDVNDIAQTVSTNRGLFRACYEKSLKLHPGIEGKFVVKFAIKPDGTVKSVDVDLSKSQIRTEDMINCALQAGRGLKFAPSATGMQSAASYPFDFHPKAAKP